MYLKRIKKEIPDADALELLQRCTQLMKPEDLSDIAGVTFEEFLTVAYTRIYEPRKRLRS
jgi:hypothetical protein